MANIAKNIVSGGQFGFIESVDERNVRKVVGDMNNFEEDNKGVIDKQHPELKGYEYNLWHSGKMEYAGHIGNVGMYKFSMIFGTPGFTYSPQTYRVKGSDGDMIDVIAGSKLKIGQIPVARLKNSRIHGVRGPIHHYLQYSDGTIKKTTVDSSYRSKINIGGYVMKDGKYEGPKRIPDNGNIRARDVYEETSKYAHDWRVEFVSSLRRHIMPTFVRYYKHKFREMVNSK